MMLTAQVSVAKETKQCKAPTIATIFVAVAVAATVAVLFGCLSLRHFEEARKPGNCKRN